MISPGDPINISAEIMMATCSKEIDKYVDPWTINHFKIRSDLKEKNV